MGRQQIVRDEGRVEIWRPRPTLVVTRAEGRIAMEHARAIMAAVDSAVREHPGQVVAVHDWTAVDSYELAVQARMSSWGLKVAGSMQRIVIGVTSPLVALAVRTASMAAGNRYEVVRDRAAIESELHRVLRG